MSRKRDGLTELPRVGYLLRMYPRFSQTFIVNEILELEKQGLDIRIASLRKPTDGIFHDSVCRVRACADYIPETLLGNLQKIRQALGKSYRRGARAFVGAARTALLRRNVTLLELAQASLVQRWAKKHKIDHLHVHFGTNEATVAWLCNRMGGPSYSLTLHAFDIFRDNVDKRLLAEKINGSRYTVTVCESNRRYLVSEVPGVIPERVRVNYNGIDLDRFTYSNGTGRDPRFVFAVGRLIEKKGFIHLVRAVEQLRDNGIEVRCEIAGDGPEEEHLRKEIKAGGLEQSVRLLGPLRQEAVQQKLRQAGCFALPCIQAQDGNVDALPTVLLEALASGCPSVSTRISGVPEILEDGVSGLISTPGDAADLARSIERLITDRQLACDIGEAGRRRAEQRFDVRRNVRIMKEHLLNELGASTPSTEVVSLDAREITAKPDRRAKPESCYVS